MNLVEEAKKLLDKGKPMVEGALEDFLKKHVKDFLFSGEFEIRKGLGVDEEMGSRESDFRWWRSIFPIRQLGKPSGTARSWLQKLWERSLVSVRTAIF